MSQTDNYRIDTQLPPGRVLMSNVWSNQNMENPPVKSETRASSEDTFIAAVSAIPYFGGPLSVGFTSYFQRAHNEKMQAWYGSVAESFNRLQADFGKLASDSELRDTLISAARVAETTSRQDKLDMLRAAVVNSSLPSRPSEEKRMRFLRLIEQMVPEHITVLKARPMDIGGGLFDIFAEQKDRDQDMEYRLRDDLEAWKLADFAGAVSLDDVPVWTGQLTALGTEFLTFISETDTQ